MAPNNVKQQRWLVALAKRVSRHIRSTPIVPSIVRRPPSSMRALNDQADGWYVEIGRIKGDRGDARSEEHTSELQSQSNLVCRLLLEKKKKKEKTQTITLSTKQL